MKIHLDLKDSKFFSYRKVFFGIFLTFFVFSASNVNAACDPTFVPSADGTKCVCPEGKIVLPGTTYCGDKAAAGANAIEVGTPNEYNPNAGSSANGKDLYGRDIITPPKEFKYTLLESLPGFFNAGEVSTDLPKLILAIYKFGIWTIGIAGMFMLTIGGIMYMGSAGNTSTASSAKGIITDALVGIAAAMAAYLFLYVINPDLTKMSINFVQTNIDEVGPGPSTSGSGNCNPITTSGNPCSVDNLKKFAQSKREPNPDDWATKASSICNAESSGKADAKSGGTCSGTPIALGLFQVNLNAEHPEIFGNVKWNRKRTTDKNRLYDPVCSLTNAALYEKYKNEAFTVNWNLEKMYSLYKSRGWQPWEVTLNGMCPKW